MRFQILLLKGGIYLDWDVIVLKPFTELLNSGHLMLMGEEKRVPGYQYAISNAVMMARPRSRFISQWLSELKHIFQPNCYTCHSVGHAPHVVERMPTDVKVLPWKAFCYPGWEKAPADALFGENHPIDEQLLGLNMDSSKKHFHESYAIHLFESHQNLVHHIQKLTENYVNTVDTNFNLIVRPLLQQ